MILDGNRLLRDLRLPYYTIANMRNMRNMKLGSFYTLFHFYRPFFDFDHLIATAEIRKVKNNRFALEACWLLDLGIYGKRLPTFVPEFEIKLLKGTQFEIEEKNYGLLRRFMTILRLVNRLADFARAAGEHEAERIMRPVLSNYHMLHHIGLAVPFLNTLPYFQNSDQQLSYFSNGKKDNI